MAVAALLLWLGTAGVGSYLLLGAIHSASAASGTEAAPPVPVPAEQHAAAGSRVPPPLRAKDRYDPPSLRRSKADSLPGLRDLAEFAHPALAFIGVGFWLGYVVSRDRLFAAIGLGILLGAICAGVAWYAVNTRAGRRAAAGPGEDSGEPDENSGDNDREDNDSEGSAGSPPPAPGSAPLAPPARLLVLHAAGAALTLLIVALVAAHV